MSIFSVSLSDDPYYCGLSARVPNFVKSSNNRTKGPPKETRESVRGFAGVSPFNNNNNNSNSNSNNNNNHGTHYSSYQPPLWHTRSYESGMGKSDSRETASSLPSIPNSPVSYFLLKMELKFVFFFPLPDSDHIESPYNHIYGRLPVPTRSYIPQAPRTMFVGEWD